MSIVLLSAGRRSKYLVILVVLLGAALLGSQAGKLDRVISTDPSESLPDGADSVTVLDAVRRFDTGETTPAVVVLRRETGLSATDRTYAARVRDDLSARPLQTAERLAPFEISPDGTTGVLLVSLRTTDDERLTTITGELRDRLRSRPDGLEVAVTGPAALTADLSTVFDGADTNLLLGASLVVVLLLIVNYRSPVFWLIPFAVVLVAEFSNQGIGYLLGSAGLTIDPASSGIASVLVFGAATDYALLLVARYREELRLQADTHRAMRHALRSAGPTIVASALTVAAALLTLLLCSVGGTQAIGPLAATGVLAAMLLTLTLLPALLLVAGRGAFWPLIPRAGSGTIDDARSAWGRVGRRIERRPRRVWVIGLAVLAVLATGLTQLSSSLGSGGEFLREPEAVRGGELLAKSFPAGTASPSEVIVPDRSEATAVRVALLERDDVVTSVSAPQTGPPGARLNVVLRADPQSTRAEDQIPALRRTVTAASPTALVGGPTAEAYDLREASKRDIRVVVPVALAVVLLILIGLLRSIVLPALVIVTVVASFAAALGVGAVAFEQLFGFTGSDASLPLIAFVFLFALGVDYTIFLAARVREEARSIGTGPGMTRALAATGTVITSAGLVLTGTFAVLAVLPLVVLAQLGFVIGIGVLLDTLVVRSVIVPALIYDIGHRVWWPSHLDRPWASKDTESGLRPASSAVA